MLLKNGKVLLSDGSLDNVDVKIEGKYITELKKGLKDEKELDLNGMYVLPGFIDTHIHGAYGCRFSEYSKADTFKKIQEFEATVGVTSVAASTTTSDFEDLLKQFDAISAAIKEKVSGAKIAGIHAEGPFISFSQKGAMNAEYIKAPSIDLLKEMISHCGDNLKIITIAPENDGAEALIKFAKENNITVSMGHTSASFEQAEAAVSYGVSQATHIFNAMKSYDKREPGAVGCALTNEKVKCEMICDFVHLHQNACKMVYMLKGSDNINIISDSDHAAGLDVPEFEIDGLMRYVKDGVVRLADGTIAGSTKTIHDGFKNLVSIGIPIEDASKMASYNPAKSLGIDAQTGSIEKGKCADIVVLDDSFNVVYTFVDGECVYSK